MEDHKQRIISLQDIREKIRSNQYKTRKEFKKDYKQILTNCALYNGEGSPYTAAAKLMVEVCEAFFQQNNEQIQKLERLINPLYNDNPLTKLNKYFLKIVSEHLLTIPKSLPFHTAVAHEDAKDYYSIIKQPMDLSLILKNCQKEVYKNVAKFLSELYLIYENSARYNGLRELVSLYLKVILRFFYLCRLQIHIANADRK